MIKRFVLMSILLTAPVLADDVNLTPQNTFSGYYNRSSMPSSQYKSLDYTRQTTNPRAELMKKKSVTEMGNINPALDGKTPMTYNQFPKNYDSSNMLHMQGMQNGMQNMFMGF